MLVVSAMSKVILHVYIVDGTSESKLTMKEAVNATVAQLCEKIAKKRGLAPGNHSLWIDEAGVQQLLQDNECPIQVLQGLGGEQQCRLLFKEEVEKEQNIPTPTFESPLCPVCRLMMRRPMVGICGHVVCEECLIVKNLATCPTCGVLLKMDEFVPCHFLNNILKQISMRKANEEGKTQTAERTKVIKRKQSSREVHAMEKGELDFSEVEEKFEYESVADAGSYAQFLGDSAIGASSARLRTLNALISMARDVVDRITLQINHQASTGRFKSFFSQHDLYPALTELKMKEKKHPLYSKVHSILLRKMKEQKYEMVTLNYDPKTHKKYSSFDPRNIRYQVTFK